MNEQKRVLVTGGAGFIGSHIVDALVERGHAVAVLDDLSTGESSNVNPSATLYRGSLSNPDTLNWVFEEFAPHWVSHHAAQISVTKSADDPIADANINVLGSLRLLEACKAHNVEYFLFASTGGGLYGEPEYMPCDEAHPVKPMAPYGAAKYSVEAYMGVYQRTWGLKAVALRYANVYGPRQNSRGEAGVIAIFADRMLSGKEMVIYGDGNQERDFVYVSDVVDANMLALERQLQGSYNVGTGVGASVNKVADILKKHCNYKADIPHAAPRPGEVQRITLDASLFRKTTKWKPKVTIEKGLAMTADYFKAAANQPQ